jgi:4-oxalocrotonate tautomerase
MPLVTMHMYPGRTPEQKAGVVRGITDAVVRELGVPAQSVEVLLIEVPREHWAFAGNLASNQTPVGSSHGAVSSGAP